MGGESASELQKLNREETQWYRWSRWTVPQKEQEEGAKLEREISERERSTEEGKIVQKGGEAGNLIWSLDT